MMLIIGAKTPTAPAENIFAARTGNDTSIDAERRIT
jgi:hypothetical protein